MAEEFSFPEMPSLPQEHDKYIPETFTAIGNPDIHRKDGARKASGKAIYTRDVILPGMLYARALSSPYANAKIKSMNTSKAEAYPGVRYVLRYDDPDVERINTLGRSERILKDYTSFYGEITGVAVAAETDHIAEEALKLIDVEWEERPFIIDQEKACESSAPIAIPEVLPDHNIAWSTVHEQGDVEKGFAESDKIIEYQYKRGTHGSAMVESYVGVARWEADNLELWVHHQHPWSKHRMATKWFGIPESNVKVNAPYNGGSFGSPYFSGNDDEVLCISAVLAKKTGRPVKCWFHRKDDFNYCDCDCVTAYFKVGFKNDGTIMAVKARSYGLNGRSRGPRTLIECTKIPHLYFELYCPWVNKPWSVTVREDEVYALTAVGVFAHVAKELGVDPIELAIINDGEGGIPIADIVKEMRDQNQGFPDIDSLKVCMDAGKAAIGWDEKWHQPGTKILPNGKMHGLGCIWAQEWDDLRGAGFAAVQIQNDGTVNIHGMHADCGVNAETAYCQIVADELGMRYEDVSHRQQDDTGFALMTPDGGCNLCSNGYVVRKAAKRAKAKLLELATTEVTTFASAPRPPHHYNFIEGEVEVIPAAFPDKKPEELDVKDSVIFEKANPENKKTVAEVAKIGSSPGSIVKAPVYAWAWHRQGRSKSAGPKRHRLTRQAHFMEVEVDPETGEIEITKVANVNDVGKVINVAGVEGQQYGGTYMGLGRGISEEMVFCPTTGVMLNTNLIDYKWATMLDCGPIDTIHPETSLGYGPYGAVGIGETVGSMLAELVTCAVQNAIGNDLIFDLPITPDKVLKSLGKA